MTSPTSPDPSPAALIVAEGLGRMHGRFAALVDASFAIPRGQVVGFLGRNGAGKTTTLRILTGTLAPTSGRAWVAGCDVTRDPAFRHRLGYLPENAPADPEPTVIEHLRFVARVRGLPRNKRAGAIDEVVARCELGEVRNRPLGALSRGFRQRVGLAQALVHAPDILILDEPTTGLDPAQVQHMRALVRALGVDRTVLFSSHALPEVQAVADRVLILDRGRLVADDTPAALGARIGGGAVRATVRTPGGVGAEAAKARVLTSLAPLATTGRLDVKSAEGGEGDAFLFEIEYIAERDARGEVAAAVVGAGLDLLALGRVAADLEAVFHAVTEASPDERAEVDRAR